MYAKVVFVISVLVIGAKLRLQFLAEGEFTWSQQKRDFCGWKQSCEKRPVEFLGVAVPVSLSAVFLSVDFREQRKMENPGWI